ncbi:MAG: hypothetical protein GEV28_06170 [Actinophytocola sp.]|uniref:hypothetical protein n=1 Tax=Actinophytocola sp. TaxID=1872138 RepID=UPI00132397AC|nr:hypothetical protein [Actinophytocola sp.]MPZ79995.1 hypothetical protein [Actinophytocola sp.]
MTAARSTRELTPTLIELLGAIGWTTEDNVPLTGVMAARQSGTRQPCSGAWGHSTAPPPAGTSVRHQWER